MDKFFVSQNTNEVIWMYYNPDSVSGGQYVLNHLSSSLINRIFTECTSDVEAFFVCLSIECRQFLIDKGADGFMEVEEFFTTEADFVGCTAETMLRLNTLSN